MGISCIFYHIKADLTCFTGTVTIRPIGLCHDLLYYFVSKLFRISYDCGCKQECGSGCLTTGGKMDISLVSGLNICQLVFYCF